MSPEAGHRIAQASVSEIVTLRDGLSRDDFNGAYVPPPVPATIPSHPPPMAGGALSGYERQLQFHEYELSCAEQRGFPPGQTAYHAGRIALLKSLLF